HLPPPSFPTRRSSDLAEPPELTGAGGRRTPGAPHALADADHGTGPDIHHLVVESHLTRALEEHVQLLDPRVRVPVARLFAGLEGDRKSTRLNSSHSQI